MGRIGSVEQGEGRRDGAYADGHPVYQVVHPATDGTLELVGTFEPPAPTKYEGSLPSTLTVLA